MNDGDRPRETVSTDTRIARDNNNDTSDGMEVDTRGSERNNASVEDKQRETSATDTRIAREDDNDPSDEMDVEIDTSEKTNANNKEKGQKIEQKEKGTDKMKLGLNNKDN
jgi:hypothetical protein